MESNNQPLKKTVRIAGIGSYIPERLMRNDDVLERLRTSSQSYLEPAQLETLLAKARHKMEKAGCRDRYWCAPEQWSPDIAAHASRAALKDAGIAPSELDFIIYTGMAKALLEPATAHILKAAIGADNANVIDTQDACVAFIKSLDLASALIQTGRIRNALVVCGERDSDFANFRCKTPEELDWTFGSLTIGDGAGAFVLQETTDEAYVSDPAHWQFRYKLRPNSWSTCTVGLNYSHGEFGRINSHSRRLFEQGQEVGNALVRQVFSEDQFRGIKFDNLFCHEVSRAVEEAFLAGLGAAGVAIPPTHRSFFPEFGNVGSASLPVGVCLAVREGRLRRGDLSAYICPSAGVQAGMLIFRY